MDDIEQKYFRLSRKQRGVIRAWFHKFTGRRLARITRLIRQYRETGELTSRAGQRHRFGKKYTAEDIALLAGVNRAHERLSRRAVWDLKSKNVAITVQPDRVRMTPVCGADFILDLS